MNFEVLCYFNCFTVWWGINIDILWIYGLQISELLSSQWPTVERYADRNATMRFSSISIILKSNKSSIVALLCQIANNFYSATMLDIGHDDQCIAHVLTSNRILKKKKNWSVCCVLAHYNKRATLPWFLSIMFNDSLITHRHIDRTLTNQEKVCLTKKKKNKNIARDTYTHYLTT